MLISNHSKEYENESQQITDRASQQLNEGITARQPRLATIKKNEDMYNGVAGAALKGRSNIPFDQVVLGGFVDALCASVNEVVTIGYGHKREQDRTDAKMMTAFAERETALDRGDWNHKFRQSRFVAALTGVGFHKLFVEGSPKFRTDLSVPDYLDMVPDPTGGPDLDKHEYKFQINIFRTKEDLLAAAKEGFYDRHQVMKLVESYTEEQFKSAQDEYANKVSRFYNMDISMRSFVGQKMYRLTEGVVKYKGKFFYTLFNHETKIWVRCEPLTNVFDIANDYPGRGPWDAWHTHEHPYLFWSKAPADDIRAVAYTMKKVVNYMVDNHEKNIWGMRAIDPSIFPDPAKLKWRHDGLVIAKRKAGGVGNMANGVYEFKTPDMVGVSINVIEWMNNFVGQQTAVNPEMKGQAATDRVGIAYANIEATSKRLTLQNDYFKRSVSRMAQALDYGAYEHLREAYAVKIIGNSGVRWEEEITRRTTEKEFTVFVKDAMDDRRSLQEKMVRRERMMARLEKNPQLLEKVNKNWLVRDILSTDGGIPDHELAVALDVNNDADEDSLERAAGAIELCLSGEELYELYRGATPAFVQKIIDYIEESFPLYDEEHMRALSAPEKKRYQKDIEKADKLMIYALKHIPIVVRNTQRKVETYVAMQPKEAATPETRGLSVPADPARTLAAMTPRV